MSAERSDDGAVKMKGRFIVGSTLSAGELVIACGRCIGCKRERARQWAVRIMHEAQSASESCFLTLTYDDDHLPKDGSLRVEDWQKFAKRFRKKLGKFRFFHCGEYGDENGRPHYHAAIFGHDFSSDREYLKTVGGNRYYVSPTVLELWPKGYHVIGDLTFESASYVASYCLKKVNGDKAEEHYGGRKPEYATMSRRPGLGAGWYEDWKDEVYPLDEVVQRGYAQRPPRFYDLRLKQEDEAMFDLLMKRRREKAAKQVIHMTPERLAARERVAKARVNYFKKDVE